MAALTPTLAAVVPVKNVFKPNAAKRPLVSAPNVNSRFDELTPIVTLPDVLRDAEIPLIPFNAASSPSTVVSSLSSPFKSTVTRVVWVSPVCLLKTRTSNDPLTGV